MITRTTARALLSTRTQLAASCALALGLGSTAFGQIAIDNDLDTSAPGYFTVSVTSGGESRDATIRGVNQTNDSLVTTDVLFDYFSYVDVGNGAFRLDNATSAPTLVQDDVVASSGSFTGSGGNTINWSVTSSMADSQSEFVNNIRFTAATGTLGDITFYQYLDEDVFGVSDDVFFTQGSIAGGDLELFTLDGATGIGVAQSGAYSASQGLTNATFAGFAADEYDDMKPRLENGTQNVSPSGVIDNADLPQTNSALLDTTVRGPADVVSVMAWEVDPNTTNATITTSLGGVSDGGALPLPEPGNFEITANPGETITQSLFVEDEAGTPLAVTLLNGAKFIGPDGTPYTMSYSTLTRVVTWDTTGIDPGEYVLSFNIRNANGAFDNGSLTVNVVDVPEPTTLALLGLGGLLVSTRRRRG